MIPWARVHLDAAADAARARRDLGIPLDAPVDPFIALVAAGIAVVRRPLEALAGAYIAADAASGAPPGVIVNSHHPISKQRYTAAHELGHHRRDGLSILDADTDWLRSGETAILSEQERRAEAFAAWFLMPRRLMQSRLGTLNIDPRVIRAEQAYELSLDVGVSYRAAVNHLADMRLLHYADRDRLLRTTPRELKVALLGGLPPGDLRRDVRRVAADRTGAAGVEGDLVVIEASEYPSSGYRWTPIAIPDELSLLDVRFERQGAREVLGSAGTRRFVLRMDQPGAATVEIQLLQPWAGGEEAEVRSVLLEAEARPRPGLVAPQLVLAAHG